MQAFSVIRIRSLSLLLMLMFALQIFSVRAADSTSVSVSFGNLGAVTPGISFPLYIHISAGPNPVRATGLQCFQNGASLSASSISNLPNASVITEFTAVQYYRAVSVGLTTVSCTFKGIDTVTGQAVTATSNTESVNVSGKPPMYAAAYSATKTATVGQAFFLMVIYGNRGKNTLTNVQVDCRQGPLGRGIAFVSSRQTQTTLPSGQSGFAEYRLQGVLRGASGILICLVTATDSVTGEMIALRTQGVPISIV